MLKEAVHVLRGRTRGEVIEPSDGGYEEAREAYNAMAAGRPAVIFRPVGPDRRRGRGAVGGGVGSPDRCPRWWPQRRRPFVPDGALLVDLSRWRGATVDPTTKTADALAGSRLMDLDAATYAYGLAAPSGTFIDTGIGGLTLSGGISWLLSSEGFACDALIGAQLVTADGEVLEVDEEHEPELLWGLRGGGGNFGVVTRLRYALTDVPAMFGGRLRFRGGALRDAILRTFEVEASAPDELVMAIVAWRAEDGSPGISVNVGWRGDPEAGVAAVRALAIHPACYERDLKPMNWLQQQTLYQPIPFGLRQYWKGHLIGRLDDTLADALICVGIGSDR